MHYVVIFSETKPLNIILRLRSSDKPVFIGTTGRKINVGFGLFNVKRKNKHKFF